MSDLELEAKHVENLMLCLPTSAQRGNWTDQVDLQELFFRFSLDSSTEYLFGATVGSQLRHLRGAQNSEPDGIDFATQFDKAMQGTYQRLMFRSLGKYVWPSGFKQACDDCHKYVDKYVKQQLERLREKPEGDPDQKKDKYLFFDALAADVKDPLQIRSQLLNILLAGRDTTASLLAWIFYTLARDPARYEKLRRIVLADFGDYSSADRLTFESLKGCSYLQHVINETLRLYPIVPLNRKHAVRDTTLPRGGGPDGMSKIFVPKGSDVGFSLYDMHRRQGHMGGKTLEEFVPERWEGKKGGMGIPARECYLVSALSQPLPRCRSRTDVRYAKFNGGPRICLGQQFALTKTAYMTVRLVQRFDKVENLDHEPILHRVLGTLHSGTGVKVRLHEAQ